jgi:hypothetical protein
MDLIASKNISLEDNNLMNPQGGMMLDIQTIDTGDLIIKGVLGISRNIVLGRAYNIDGDKTSFFEGLVGVYGLSIQPDGSYCDG